MTLNPHDIQSRVGTYAMATEMLTLWIEAGAYLRDSGDLEGAWEALEEAEYWRELTELAQCEPYVER